MFLSDSLYCKVPRVGMICTSYVLWVLQKSVCRLLYDVIKASMASIAAIPLYYMNFKDLIGFLVTNRSPEAVHRKIKLESRSIHLQSTKLWCLFNLNSKNIITMPIVAHQRYYDIIIANVFLMKFEIVTYLKYVPPLHAHQKVKPGYIWSYTFSGRFLVEHLSLCPRLHCVMTS